MGKKRNREVIEDHGSVRYVKHSKIPTVLVIAIIVLSIVIGVSLGKSWQKAKSEKDNHVTTITSDVLHQQLEQIGELATVSYYYTNMGKFEDAIKWFEHDVPFTTKSFIVSYDGVIKAGIDVSKTNIEIEKVNDENYKVIVTVPEATITSHEPDMDSVTLYDEKNSIFNELSAEDVTGFLASQNQLMEEKAINNGLLNKAQENAQIVMETMLKSIVQTENTKATYNFVFQISNVEK